MIRQRTVQHRRKNSQIDLFHPSFQFDKNSQQKNPPKHKKHSHDSKKLKISMQEKTCDTNGRSILKLIENCDKKISKKSTLVDNIDCQWGDENVDYSNLSPDYQLNGNQTLDQNHESFFQFGRKSRQSSVSKKQIPSIDFNICNNIFLSMEEIIEVPDTMSNSRRYENNSSCHYQFSTQNQNSWGKFTNKLIENETEKESDEILTPIIKNSELKKEKSQDAKNLKKRRQKLPKTNHFILENQQLQKRKTQEFSDITKCNKKTKLFFVNKNEHKKSKCKQQLTITNKIQKQKSRNTLLPEAKSKEILSHSTLTKNKSLSLKSETKLKLHQKSKFSSSLGEFQAKNNQSTGKLSKISQKFIKDSSSIQKSKTRNSEIEQKIQIISESQSKLQSQYKILWECVEQLWENSRITRYISQKNKADLNELKDGEKQLDEKLINLKGEILSSISSARY